MEHLQNLIPVQEFAEQMKKSIAIGSNKVYDLVKEPGFPAIKIGSRYYVMTDQVDEWMEKTVSKRDQK